MIKKIFLFLETVYYNLHYEYGTWNGQQWAEGYKTEIPKLRNAGICNLIMADCAGWGQYPDSIKGYGKSVYDADPDHNVCFSIHMYEYPGETEDIVVQNINNALYTGVPVVIRCEVFLNQKTLSSSKYERVFLYNQLN